ncbi:MAG: hypothetical protein RL431_44 [Actinomycetota bacterium]|jgi:hypothetical protein
MTGTVHLAEQSTARRVRTIVGVAFVSALLLVYIGFAVYMAALLVTTADPFTFTFGIALFVAPAIGVWSLVRELRFGRDAARLHARLRAEGGELPQVPIVNRRDSVAVQAALDSAPTGDDWRSILRRALIIDAVGTRAEARREVRKAIAAAKSEA